jgi:hypothetical protein
MSFLRTSSAAQGRESVLPTEPKYASSSFWQHAAIGYEDTWESSDGLSYAEGKVLAPDGPWPAMVSVDAIDLSSLAEHDARSLAAWLTTLADLAHHWNRSVSRV